MRAESSADPAAVESASPALELGRAARIALLAMNAFPLFHGAGIVFLAARAHPLAALGALYLAPPLLTRAVFLLLGRPEGRYRVGSPEFFTWWASLQLQMLFNRLPLLEELLRLVPGLYSSWLRLWGSRVGRLSYWSPGTTILDRSYLCVGDDVTLGAGARLSGHVLTKNAAGRVELVIATIKLGDRSILGGYSLLSAGSELAPDEATRAVLQSPPFTLWKGGRHARGEATDGRPEAGAGAP